MVLDQSRIWLYSPKAATPGKSEECATNAKTARGLEAVPTLLLDHAEELRTGLSEEVDIGAPRDSDAWYLALMARQFPGSFLHWGREQVIDCAGRRFRLLESFERPPRLPVPVNENETPVV